MQQSTVFNTTNTHYTITTGDIPVGFDICSNYTWSVVAIYDGRASQTITSNETISSMLLIIQYGIFVCGRAVCHFNYDVFVMCNSCFKL